MTATSPLPNLTGRAAVMSLRDVTKTYRLGDTDFQALAGVSLDIHEGEMVALTGPSGSGKTTLMHIIGLLDRPTTGTYELRGRDVTDLTENERAGVRNHEIGFVFQAFHLLPRLSTLENVEVPLVYAGVPARERLERAEELLTRVGLQDKMRNLPSQLSGGQRQRVAIARALAVDPSLILADEPTGNLDTHTGDEVMALFSQLNDEGVTVVIVTHEADIAAQTKRIVHVRDGLVIGDGPNEPRRPDLELRTRSGVGQ
ncbi:MAG TPA: ABC transporter ATP-binding protein [Deinococcales bacterium]|nr:ABC transporter ATP-binding protein [Deinococcales bacterium]